MVGEGMSTWLESQKRKPHRGTSCVYYYPLFITVLYHFKMVLRTQLNYGILMFVRNCERMCLY